MITRFVGLTLIVASASATDAGTRAPQSFVTLANEEYVCIDMIPGMTGTLMPTTKSVNYMNQMLILPYLSA